MLLYPMRAVVAGSHFLFAVYRILKIFLAIRICSCYDEKHSYFTQEEYSPPFRKEHIMEHLKFEDMNLSPEICQAVLDMGFEEATPIQSQAISVIMKGNDVTGQSQTGTGKTAAFGIPCLERIDPEDRRLQALILCPTFPYTLSHRFPDPKK